MKLNISERIYTHTQIFIRYAESITGSLGVGEEGKIYKNKKNYKIVQFECVI